MLIKEFSYEMQSKIEKFFEIVINARGWGFDPTGRHSFVKDISSAFPTYKGGLWIAEADNRIIGTVAIRSLVEADCIGELKSMYVLPEYQGKGYGYLLLNYALQKADEFGYKIIRLDTAKDSINAISLYKKCGFYEIEKYNDNIFAEVCMEKRISNIG
jgi:GNAT superfamily N-acetyltransferase